MPSLPIQRRTQVLQHSRDAAFVHGIHTSYPRQPLRLSARAASAEGLPMSFLLTNLD